MKVAHQQVQYLRQNVHVRSLRAHKAIQSIKTVITRNEITTTADIATRANVRMNDIHIHQKIGITMLPARRPNKPIKKNTTKRRKIVHVQAFRAVAVVRKNLKSKVCVCTRARNNINPITNVAVISHATRNTAKHTNVTGQTHRVKVVRNRQVPDIVRDATIVPIHIHRRVLNRLPLLRHAVHHDHTTDARTKIINVANTHNTTNIHKILHAPRVRLALQALAQAVRAPVPVAVHRAHQVRVGQVLRPVVRLQARVVAHPVHQALVHPVQVHGVHRHRRAVVLQARHVKKSY